MKLIRTTDRLKARWRFERDKFRFDRKQHTGGLKTLFWTPETEARSLMIYVFAEADARLKRKQVQLNLWYELTSGMHDETTLKYWRVLEARRTVLLRYQEHLDTLNAPASQRAVVAHDLNELYKVIDIVSTPKR